MTRFLVNLEVIVEGENLLRSEVETTMHKMVQTIKYMDVHDYGLDVDYFD